jgi:hypothetical protein
MKMLGRGWQYSVYDLGNGRVLKKYNSVPVGYLHIFKTCFPFKDDPVWRLPSYYKGCKETARDSLQKLPTLTLENWKMGNPKILNSLDYEHDKVVPLHDHFGNVDTQAGKQTIDAFIAFNKQLIESGLIDKSFNITKNFGLDVQGRVVLIDIGELFTSPISIEKQIRNRAWSAHYVVDPLPEALRAYFVEEMDKAFCTSISS